LILKTKTEKAKSRENSLFLVKISFKIIKEKTIAGKSGLGDCTKKNKTGEKQSITHDFFSMIYKKNIIRRSTFILRNSSEKCENTGVGKSTTWKI